MDWHTRTDEIQERYFRTGPRTCLWIECAKHDPTILTWSFTFMDIGMCHTISGHARVVKVSKNGPFKVNELEYPDENQALAAVFQGHLQDFQNRFYKQMSLFV